MNIHRALVTAQNTFLENVTGRLQGRGCPFLLGSARIADYPVVYASDGFATLTGYGRGEVLQQTCTLRYMWSDRCSPDATQRLQRGFDSREPFQTELALHRKNHSCIWVLFKMTPIQNEKGAVVLFLCVLRDITAQKQPIAEDGSVAGLSKFARLVRQVARNKAPPPAAPKPDYSFVLTTTAASGGLEKLAPAAADSEWEQSAGATPRYIHEAPKAAPHILLHYSPFKATWDWLILFLTLYTAVVVPYYLSFRTRTLDDVAVIVVNGLVDVIFFVDVMLNFHTTYVGKAGDVVSDPKVIRSTYLRTWCAIDVLSCLPYDLFNAVQYWTSVSSSAVSTLKILRLLRLVRVARKLDHYIEYGAALLVLILVMFVVIGHWFACIWYYIGTSEVIDRRYNWLNSLANLTGSFYYWKNGSTAIAAGGTAASGGSQQQQLQWAGGPAVGSAYVTALYFTLSCMTSVGFGNVSASTDYEKLFACLMMIAGALLYASIFGNVTAIMQQFMSSSSQYRDMMNSVKKFVKLYQVPSDLSERISDYVVSLWVVTKGIDQEKILNNCPKDIKADICIHLHQKVLKEHPGFRLASEGCLRALALQFTTTHSAPGDILYHQGESVDQLCFVVSGSLEVVQDDEVVAILSNGDTFGDDFWNHATAAQSVASVRALTYCSIHCIKRDKLMDVLGFYQAFYNAFRRNMIITFPLRQRLVFRKIEDILRQRELEEKYRNQPKMELPDNQFVRKFLSKLAKSVHSVQEPSEGTPKSVASYVVTQSEQPPPPPQPPASHLALATATSGEAAVTPMAAVAASAVPSPKFGLQSPETGVGDATAASGRVGMGWGRFKFGPAHRASPPVTSEMSHMQQLSPTAASADGSSPAAAITSGIQRSEQQQQQQAVPGGIVASKHSPQPSRRRAPLVALFEAADDANVGAGGEDVGSGRTAAAVARASLLVELADVRCRLANIERYLADFLGDADVTPTQADSLNSTPVHSAAASSPSAHRRAADAAARPLYKDGGRERAPEPREGGRRASATSIKWPSVSRKRSPKVHPTDRSAATSEEEGDAIAMRAAKGRWNDTDLDLL